MLHLLLFAASDGCSTERRPCRRWCDPWSPRTWRATPCGWTPLDLVRPVRRVGGSEGETFEEKQEVNGETQWLLYMRFYGCSTVLRCFGAPTQ